MSELRDQLQGVWCFAVTPFRREQGSIEIDPDSSYRYGVYLAEAGLPVIAPCGGNGEFYSLTLDEYRLHLGALARGLGGCAAIVPGVGGPPAQLLEMAAFAASIGCPAVLVMLPTFPPSEAALVQYYEWICQSVATGVVVFQLPNALISEKSLLQLADRCPNFVGVKEEVGDPFYFRRLSQAVGDRLLVVPACGEATAAVYYLLGARGYTSGLCNLAPGLSGAIHEACLKGDYDRALQLGRQAEALTAIRGRYGGPVPLKVGLQRRGVLADSVVRPPLAALPEEAGPELLQVLTILEGVG